MKSIKTILGNIRNADQTYSLFNENDRIMIGVSGGKDSMALVYCLSLYKKFPNVKFEIFPTILDLGFDGFDAEPIKKYVESLGLTLNVVDAKDVYPILKANQKDAKHLPCSICSRMKKAAINKAAKELGCNKVAFAHHADDAIETLLMNAIYGGRVATFQPKMHLERADVMFIRPFIHVRESEIKKLIKEENIPVFGSHCPNDGFTQRSETKELLEKFYEQYPSSKENFLTMLSNYKKEVLFNDDIYYKLEKKDLSLRPVINANDALIENEIRNKKNKLNFDPTLERFIIYKVDKPIGILSFKRNESNIEVVDLFFIRDSKVYTELILKFSEIKIARKLKEFNLVVTENIDKDILIKLGYEKTRINGLIKHIIQLYFSFLRFAELLS